MWCPLKGKSYVLFYLSRCHDTKWEKARFRVLHIKWSILRKVRRRMKQEEWTLFPPLVSLGLLASMLLQFIQNLCKVVASDLHNQVTNLQLTFTNNIPSFNLHRILEVAFQCIGHLRASYWNSCSPFPVSVSSLCPLCGWWK